MGSATGGKQTQPVLFIPRSSNGRTTDSDSVYVGSNPARGSIFIAPSSNWQERGL
jgi:hypothetical protein